MVGTNHKPDPLELLQWASSSASTAVLACHQLLEAHWSSSGFLSLTISDF